MAIRLSLQTLAEKLGFISVPEMLEHFETKDRVPAVCESGCEVSQVGTCIHGHPSITEIANQLRKHDNGKM